MKNETRKSVLTKLGVIALGLMLAMCMLAPMQRAKADSQRYCDDETTSMVTLQTEDEIFSSANLVLENEEASKNSIIMPRGEGGSYSDEQIITYDYKEMSVYKKHYSAPSLGIGDPNMPNVCAPVSGANVVQFYDKFYTNLIPNFSPGMINGGKYTYFPDGGFPQTKETIVSLYNYMGTNVGGGGTTFTGFKNGLQSYMNTAGYNVSYSSFYSSSTTVNLSLLANAIDNNKVGVIFLSAYNYIYYIMNNVANTTKLVKINASRGHAMMVYGYKIVKYYKNGVNFQTDTYLHVSSAFSTRDQGFMKLNDFSYIDNAIIVNVS